MKTEKQVRTWWIGIGGGGVYNKEDEFADYKVVDYEDHLAIVTELEKDYLKLQAQCEKLAEQLTSSCFCDAGWNRVLGPCYNCIAVRGYNKFKEEVGG